MINAVINLLTNLILIIIIYANIYIKYTYACYIVIYCQICRARGVYISNSARIQLDHRPRVCFFFFKYYYENIITFNLFIIVRLNTNIILFTCSLTSPKVSNNSSQPRGCIMHCGAARWLGGRTQTFITQKSH